MERQTIYLDHAATTPLDPRVVEAMRPYWSDVYGNTSSMHRVGRAARKAVDEARQVCAEILGCHPQEIVFTGSGTESDNLALRGVAWACRKQGRHLYLITTPVEHHAVGHTAEQLTELFDVDLTILPVDGYGRVDPDDVGRAIQNSKLKTQNSKPVFLVSVMYANNEVGTIQPLADIGRLVRANNGLMHTDAVQAASMLHLKVDDLQVDLLALSAHKFYGPKGVGLLYIRDGTDCLPALTGGGHEHGRRPGTLDVAGIVGLATALCLAQESRESENARLLALRERLVTGLLARVPDVVLTGHPSERLPNNASFAFKSVQGEALVMALDLEGICASAGSACTGGEREPSFVLSAMGLEREWALGSLRLALGRVTTEAELNIVLDLLPRLVERLRGCV
jgi:cysteine desulfurase